MLKAIKFLFLPILLASCGQGDKVFFEYQNLNNGNWAASDTIRFDLPKFNPEDNYNLFLNVRNDRDYPFSNLFVITYLENPNGEIVIDTLEYEMAKPNGEWLGSGMGSVKESKLWYKEGMQFKDTGNYKISVRHAMRKNGTVEGIENLRGITDIGFEIEGIR